MESSSVSVEGINAMEHRTMEDDSTLPSHIVRAFQTLEMNVQYQNILREQLKKIEQAQQRNQELQKKIRLFITQATKATRTTKVGAPPTKQNIFVDEDNESPPDNPDTIRKQQTSRMPLQFKTKKWSKDEVKGLCKGVRAQKQQRLLEELNEKLKKGGTLTFEQYNKEILAIRNLPDSQLPPSSEGLDWDIVSKNFVPSRNAVDCKLRWENYEDPTIDKSAWSKEDDKRLLSLAIQHKGHDWIAIAKEFPGRSPESCFRRYQRSLNTTMLKSKWSEEDDQVLTEAVKRYGEKNWQQVANCLEGRTGQQCLHRWMKTLNPNIRRGKWTPQEDKMLAIAVNAYGSGNWTRIHKHIPGRTDVQCRERWVNVLNPELNAGPWTPEEDEKLKQAVAKHGLGKWSTISQELYPRTDNQCWRRWKALNADAVDDYKQVVQKRKKALVGNFAGRAKERPSLTPDDIEFETTENSQKQSKKRNYSRKSRGRKRKDEEDEDEISSSSEGENILSSEHESEEEEQDIDALVESDEEELKSKRRKTNTNTTNTTGNTGITGNTPKSKPKSQKKSSTQDTNAKESAADTNGTSSTSSTSSVATSISSSTTTSTYTPKTRRRKPKINKNMEISTESSTTSKQPTPMETSSTTTSVESQQASTSELSTTSTPEVRKVITAPPPEIETNSDGLRRSGRVRAKSKSTTTHTSTSPTSPSPTPQTSPTPTKTNSRRKIRYINVASTPQTQIANMTNSQVNPINIPITQLNSSIQINSPNVSTAPISNHSVNSSPSQSGQTIRPVIVQAPFYHNLHQVNSPPNFQEIRNAQISQYVRTLPPNIQMQIMNQQRLLANQLNVKMGITSLPSSIAQQLAASPNGTTPLPQNSTTPTQNASPPTQSTSPPMQKIQNFVAHQHSNLSPTQTNNVTLPNGTLNDANNTPSEQQLTSVSVVQDKQV